MTLSHNSSSGADDDLDDAAFLAIKMPVTPLNSSDKRTESSPDTKSKNDPPRKKSKLLFGNAPFRIGEKVDYNEFAVTSLQSEEEGIPIQQVSSKQIPNQQVSSFEETEYADLKQKLSQVMQRHFGFASFRKGQFSIMANLIQDKRDSAAFWPTGWGKSLVYQLPAIYLDQTCIVVSPLISLMQDQCNKINSLMGREVAAFLGSAQTDDSVYYHALQGKYNLVYATPESFVNSGLLSTSMNSNLEIAFFAIDEAHCVSEWGHDFRPEYRSIGNKIRSNEYFKNVPILALTAITSSRVRSDVQYNLKLKNPFISVHSVDRDNFEIFIKQKPSSPITALRPYLTDLKESTILYVPTRRQVDDFYELIVTQFPDVSVAPYHAGLSAEERTRAHFDFLVGKVSLIIATIAFGMGIDKPDIRQVLHYGAPKTMEDYYQQIGRAGRDGLPAKCVMWVNDADFNRYKSDYFTENINASHKAAIEASTEAFRKFSLNNEECRRAGILRYFEETDFPFGSRCGKCDTCLLLNEGIELERDFSQEGGKVILTAVHALKEPAMSVLEKVMAGNVVDSWKYCHDCSPEEIQRKIVEERKLITKRATVKYLKELVNAMVLKNYINQQVKKMNINGYSKAFSIFSVTPDGFRALNAAPGSKESQIILPIPSSIIEAEKKAREQRQKDIEQLEQQGIDISKIPNEKDDENDEILQAYKHWNGYIETLTRNGKKTRVDQLNDLQKRIMSWRQNVAEKQKIAPFSVLADHIMMKAAYTSASCTSRNPIREQALFDAGVRINTEGLVEVIKQWINETDMEDSSNAQNSVAEMILDGVFKPSKPWHLAKTTSRKTPAWLDSYEKFSDGIDIQTIAMTKKKPIQVNTVVGHIFDALLRGNKVDLEKLSAAVRAPNQEEWIKLETAEKTMSLDITDDNEVRMSSLLEPILGSEVVWKPYAERTQEETITYANWCNLVKWYMTLRRLDYEPKFSK